MFAEDWNLKQDSLLPLILGSGSDDPYPVYDHLRSNHPVHRDASGMWLVSPHALVTSVLYDRGFSARPPVPVEDPLNYLGMVVFQSGEQHDRLRGLLAPLFSKSRLAILQDFIDVEIARLLAPLRQTRRFDLVADVACMLPVRTICHLLGFPEAAAHSYLEASTGAWRLISGARLSAGEYRQAVEETDVFLHSVERIIEDAGRAGASDHAIHHFLQLEARGDLSRREMLANILFLFIAGYGTTLLSIGNSVAAALRDPHLWQLLREDPAWIPQAVRELLRYDASVQAVFRYAWRDAEVGGQRIRRGEQVALLVGSANRDPDEFARPGDIDVRRTKGRSLTFGAGPHGCMGVMLARMQLESLLRELLRQMPDIALSSTENCRSQRGSFHGFSRLWLEHD